MNKVGIAHPKAHISEHLRRVRRGATITELDRDTRGAWARLSHEEVRKVFEAIKSEPRLTAAWWALLFLTAARDKEEVMG